MITVGVLRKILERLPDRATLMSYTGNYSGLSVKYKDAYGWIETGWTQEDKREKSRDDLSDIERKILQDFDRMMGRRARRSVASKE